RVLAVGHRFAGKRPDDNTRKQQQCDTDTRKRECILPPPQSALTASRCTFRPHTTRIYRLTPIHNAILAQNTLAQLATLKITTPIETNASAIHSFTR
ncbi:hypothetical protein, partial [Burkholderia vietnamiensis]|uniref:hypothetical protein n=1 Tax=Burkholderia vietnamiensis TaxID=60552 RepID=UPI003F4974D5